MIRCELPPRPGRGAAAPVTFPAPLSPRRVATPAARGTTRAVARAAPAPAPRPAAVVPLSYIERVAMSEAVAVSDLYARHEPQRIEIEGAAPHPSPLWERAAITAVAPPLPAARPLLPPRLAAEGRLSAAQLATLVMAEDAHAHELPGRRADSEDWTEVTPAAGDGSVAAYRQGTFLGDGTGAGKGRQVAGSILAGWLAGRARAVWLSRSRTLIEDSRRDWADLGGAPTDVVPPDRWRPEEAVTPGRGILFVTYATPRVAARGPSGSSGGPVAASKASSPSTRPMPCGAQVPQGRAGARPSQPGTAGLRLPATLPHARVFYISATGGKDVTNLAYATRLGLWGPGDAHPFATREDFVAAMGGRRGRGDGGGRPLRRPGAELRGRRARWAQAPSHRGRVPGLRRLRPRPPRDPPQPAPRARGHPDHR